MHSKRIHRGFPFTLSVAVFILISALLIGFFFSSFFTLSGNVSAPAVEDRPDSSLGYVFLVNGNLVDFLPALDTTSPYSKDEALQLYSSSLSGNYRSGFVCGSFSSDAEKICFPLKSDVLNQTEKVSVQAILSVIRHAP